MRLGEGREEVFEELNDFAIQIPDEYMVSTREDLYTESFSKFDFEENESQGSH